jgi:hypothetical protein
MPQTRAEYSSGSSTAVTLHVADSYKQEPMQTVHRTTAQQKHNNILTVAVMAGAVQSVPHEQRPDRSSSSSSNSSSSDRHASGHVCMYTSTCCSEDPANHAQKLHGRQSSNVCRNAGEQTKHKCCGSHAIHFILQHIGNCTSLLELHTCMARECHHHAIVTLITLKLSCRLTIPAGSYTGWCPARLTTPHGQKWCGTRQTCWGSYGRSTRGS